MTRREAFASVGRLRARISHDLFQNCFGAALQPGWQGDRLSHDDIVLKALEGDPVSCDLVGEALAVWEVEVWPAIEGMCRDIPKVHGYVPSSVWAFELTKLEASGAVIRQVLSLEESSMSAKARAALFWEACDHVSRFLLDIRTRFAEFFIDWLPEGQIP